MKRLIFSGFLVFIAFPLFFAQALGSAESSVDAQVTTEEISLLITGTFPIDYGVVPFGEESSAFGPFNINNTGTVDEDFEFKGENATNGSISWDLSDTVGFNAFSHQYKVDVASVYSNLGSDYAVVRQDITPSNNFTTRSQLVMPTGSSDTGVFTTKFWVRATASL